MSTQATVQSSIGVGGAAFLVLLVLKVMGLINMHWFWVLTSFVWIPLAMFCAVMAGMAIIMILVGAAAMFLSWIGVIK